MSVSILADFASILGVIIAIGGFLVTIRDVEKARKAAEEARQAARETVFRLGERLLEADIDLTIQFLNEIVSACRAKDWNTALLRAGDVSIRLTRMSNHSCFTAEENDDMTLAIKSTSSLNKVFETKRIRLSTEDLSERHFTKLHDVIIQLGRVIGRIRSRAFEI